MPDTLDTPLFELPVDALSALISPDTSSGPAEGRTQIEAQLRGRIEAARTRQREWTHQFDKLYDDAVRGNFSAPFLMQWTAALLEKQRAALEILHPFIEDIQIRLVECHNRKDVEMQQVFYETIDLVFGWVIPYQVLSAKLLDLASERRAATTETLRARPVKGKIDHPALTREIIARYPKILAALAK